MRLLLLVFATGCVSRAAISGGTPGPAAIRCDAGATACRSVQHALEMRRHNIGGWCGFLNHKAFMTITAEGAAAIPYLVLAFDDRDTEVGQLAMNAAVSLGRPDVVASWCHGVHDLTRADLCRDALASMLVR